MDRRLVHEFLWRDQIKKCQSCYFCRIIPQLEKIQQLFQCFLALSFMSPADRLISISTDASAQYLLVA